MFTWHLIVNVIFVLACGSGALGQRHSPDEPDDGEPIGLVLTDLLGFEKILPKLKTCVVNFASQKKREFDKEQEFIKFGSELVSSKNILFVRVEVKYNGHPLIEKFNLTDNLPSMKILEGSMENPIDFDGEWKREDMQKWLRSNTKSRVTMADCVGSLDELTEKFISVKQQEQKKLLEKARKQLANLKTEGEKRSGEVYIKIMEMIVERGMAFVASEEARVNNLLSGKMSDDKRKNLKIRLNILNSFKFQKESSPRDEL